MKKEKIILAIVIAAFSIYLSIMEKDKNKDTLPKLDEIKTSEITEISLSKDGQTISIKRKDASWVLTDKEYPVDQSKIDNILDAIRKIEPSSLVSEKNDLEKYGLDPQNSIGVQVKKEGQILREFDVGKMAPDNSHAFVRLKGSPNIYQVAGDFTSNFKKIVSQLREKSMLSFDSGTIE